DAAQRLRTLLDKALGLARQGHIGKRGVHPAAMLLELTLDFLERDPGTATDADVTPFLGQAERNGAADAAASSGNKCHLTSQMQVHSAPSSRRLGSRPSIRKPRMLQVT